MVATQEYWLYLAKKSFSGPQANLMEAVREDGMTRKDETRAVIQERDGKRKKAPHSEYPTTGKGVEMAMRMDEEREREVASLFGHKDHDYE